VTVADAEEFAKLQDLESVSGTENRHVDETVGVPPRERVMRLLLSCNLMNPADNRSVLVLSTRFGALTTSGFIAPISLTFEFILSRLFFSALLRHSRLPLNGMRQAKQKKQNSIIIHTNNQQQQM